MKAVVFDVDGTLAESNALDDAACVVALAEAFGLEDVSTDGLS